MRLLAIALAFALPPGRACAWNDVGHMAVSKFAWEQLDDGTKARVDALLRKHPHYEEHLAANRPKGAEQPEWAFLRASVWPDWIRPAEKDPRGERVTKYHRPVDHYTNLPFIPADVPADFKPQLPDADQHDVLSALKQRSAELANDFVALEDKAVALCWLEHLIGDLHQPLHAATLFSPLVRDGDRGGNLFAVKVNGAPWKLHAYWDDVLGRTSGGFEDTAGRMAQAYDRATEVVGTLRGDAFTRDKLKDDLAANASFLSWAKESNAAAIEVAYRNGTLKPARTGPKGQMPKELEEAVEGYAAAAKATALKRAALAGHRLADRVKLLVKEPKQN